MIEVEGLTKSYGGKNAVDNISFNINKGEIVGFLGPNGAGKTTTMNMLTGYLSSNVGKIRIDGYDILENPYNAKKNVGYLPEHPPLYPDLTVNEYLGFVYDLKKCRFHKKEHLEEICEVTKISDVSGRIIRNLSKGYKQRVGLAQALVGNPEILILDEPTIGLDPREIIEIRNLIRRLGVNHTIILSSHILTEIQAVCERVIIINEGRIIKDAMTEKLLSSATKTDRYAIRIMAPEDKAKSVISRLDGVLKVEYLGTFEQGTVDLCVESDKNADIRKVLFDECSKRSWYILMITPLGMSLEDIFIQLVDGEDSVKAIQAPSSKTLDDKNADKNKKQTSHADKIDIKDLEFNDNPKEDDEK